MFIYLTGETCCSGYKITIFNIKDGYKNVIETKDGFSTKEDAEDFGKEKIKQLEENNGK